MCELLKLPLSTTSYLGSNGRRKRSSEAEDAFGSGSLNLTEVASEAIAADLADVGDSWTFELTIDLPGVAVEDNRDLKVELFGLDAAKGVFGFHMCQGR